MAGLLEEFFATEAAAIAAAVERAKLTRPDGSPMEAWETNGTDVESRIEPQEQDESRMANRTGRGTFRKGDPRINPGGRPKGRSITALLNAELDRACAEGSPVTNREMIAAMLVKLASKGDLAAIREVLDRTEGKAIARTESGDLGAFTGLEDVPTTELLRLVKRDGA